MTLQRTHNNSFVSLKGFVPFVTGLKKRVRTIYYKQLLIVGCRVWENQRNFFATGVVSLVFLENTDDLILKDQLVLCSDFQNTSKKAVSQ